MIYFSQPLSNDEIVNFKRLRAQDRIQEVEWTWLFQGFSWHGWLEWEWQLEHTDCGLTALTKPSGLSECCWLPCSRWPSRTTYTNGCGITGTCCTVQVQKCTSLNLRPHLNLVLLWQGTSQIHRYWRGSSQCQERILLLTHRMVNDQEAPRRCVQGEDSGHVRSGQWLGHQISKDVRL